jgi:hypothetical protein
MFLLVFKTKAFEADAVPAVTDRYPFGSPPPLDGSTSVLLMYSEPDTCRLFPTYKLLATATPPLIVKAPPLVELVASTMDPIVVGPVTEREPSVPT